MNMLIKFELLKFFNNRKFAFGFLSIGLISFLSGYVLYLLAPVSEKPSGFLMLGLTLNFIYPFLCLLSAIIGALSFSLEYEQGTLSMLLLGKISRNKIIFSKTISIFIVSTLALLVVFLSTLFSGFLFSHFKGIEAQGYIVKSSISLWSYIGLTFLLLTVSVYIYGVMGFLGGIIMKQSLPSLFLIIGAYFLLVVFSLFPKIQDWVFSGYTDLPVALFSKISKGINVSYLPDLLFFILVNIFYIFLFISLEIFIFKKVEL